MTETRVELEKHVWDKSEIEEDGKNLLVDFLFDLDERIKALEQFVKESQKEKLNLKDYSQMVIDKISKDLNIHGR